jgi:protein-tyrosine kinase
MSRAHEMRKRSEAGAEILRAVDAELEQPVGSTMGSIPFSAMEEGLPLNMRSPLDSEVSETLDPMLAGFQVRPWNPDSETMISFAGAQPSRGAEEMRTLRSQLYRLRDKQPIKSLLLTSALPKEGRSFVAVNLANVMALQPRCRVLLIDADLRGPRLHSVLGTSRTPGLSEYLSQEADEFSIMQRGAADELFFIPAGRSVPGPTELLATGRLKSLIDRCESLFDWIIIDSPATLPVSDASLIANSCDGVLIVVRSDSTPFDVVRQARERFRPESLVGVVLNGIEAKSSPAGHYPYGSSQV